jgi:6-phosphogluconolactonase
MARRLAFVGSLNRATPYFGASRGRGISVLTFDDETGALMPLAETDGIDNPSFLVLAGDGRTLYATSEVSGWHEGVVTAYRVGDDGRLTYINKQPTLGSIAAQAAAHPSGRWLLVANYRMGADGVRPARAVAVFPVEADGGLGPAAHAVSHTGSGPNADRQEGSHPHCVLFTADGRHALVADLGIDRVVAYRFDAEAGRLEHAAELAMPPGSGPRHLAWVSDGIAVVTGELDNTVTSLAWDGAGLRLLDRASTLPDGFEGVSHASDIHVAPDGRLIHAANRGHDSLATFSVDAAGKLAALGHRPTGPTPRQFTLDPAGRFVLVASQDGHEVLVHRRDIVTGWLSEPVARAAIGSAMCVVLGPPLDPGQAA